MKEIDLDKLKLFITTYYGSIRRFSIMLGYSYLHITHTLNEIGGRVLRVELYDKIINKLNEGYKVDNFTIKPLKKISKSYFYKK